MSAFAGSAQAGCGSVILALSPSAGLARARRQPRGARSFMSLDVTAVRTWNCLATLQPALGGRRICPTRWLQCIRRTAARWLPPHRAPVPLAVPAAGGPVIHVRGRRAASPQSSCRGIGSVGAAPRSWQARLGRAISMSRDHAARRGTEFWAMI